MKKLSPCHSCGKLKNCTIKVTESQDEDTIIEFNLCEECGKTYTPKNGSVIELQNIDSPEQLLDWIFGDEAALGPLNKEPCPKCGLTVEQFDESGKFGCTHCYNHFHEAMTHAVFPYHGADKHVGKKPKNWQSPQDLEEKIKLLSLKKTRAIEHQKYNEAAQLRNEIEQLRKLLAQKS